MHRGTGLLKRSDELAVKTHGQLVLAREACTARIGTRATGLSSQIDVISVATGADAERVSAVRSSAFQPLTSGCRDLNGFDAAEVIGVDGDRHK